MREKSLFGLLVCAILVGGVLIAGCSSQSTDTTPVTTTPVPLEKYAAGDIIARSAASASQSAYLILGYDAKKDVYSRAWIYRNADGSWGHRIDVKNDTMSRDIVEKTYTEKISHLAVTSVPIVAITAPPTVVTTTGAGPDVTNITPMTGATDTTVTVTVTGSNFQQGATLKLLRGGSPIILASAVSASDRSLTGTFNLKNAGQGYYTVIVTNPDGQASSFANGFLIGDAAPLITSVFPNSGSLKDKFSITINGQNFGDLAKVTFSQGSNTIPDLYITNPQTIQGTKLSFTLEIPKNTPIGDWDVTVLNVADHTSGTWSQKFHITNATA